MRPERFRVKKEQVIVMQLDGMRRDGKIKGLGGSLSLRCRIEDMSDSRVKESKKAVPLWYTVLASKISK